MTGNVATPDYVPAEFVEHIRQAVPFALKGKGICCTCTLPGEEEPSFAVAVFHPCQLQAVMEALAGPGGKITDVTDEWPTMGSRS